MDCVVDSVETLCLCKLCKLGLAEGSAILRLNSHLKVLLRRVGHDLTEKLGELGGVLSFFVSCLLPVETDLGITLSVGDSRHCKIHADLATLACEVVSETLEDLGINVLGNADNMLGSPGHALVLLDELLSGSAADGALEALRNRIAFINITANGTYEFHNDFSFTL